jgi:transcriptional regulator with XRE-family HTH domain
MSKTLTEKLASLPKARRKRIAARAAELEAEELSLRALRQARKLTQEHMAKALGVAQESVSRLETRKDVLISTLNHYVEAMGGRLRVTVEFPDMPPVRLAELPPPSRRSVTGRTPKARTANPRRKMSRTAV